MGAMAMEVVAKGFAATSLSGSLVARSYLSSSSTSLDSRKPSSSSCALEWGAFHGRTTGGRDTGRRSASFSVSLPMEGAKLVQGQHGQSKPAEFLGIRCETGSSTVSTTAPVEWLQRTVDLPGFKRGCHVITRHIVNAVPEISQFHIGIAHIFVMHTSASLTINENASPDVPLDMEDTLNRIVPEGHQYRHLDEGLDDMPAHVKASMMGSSLTIPIKAGRLNLGIWQGIWLNEHRNYGGPRSICVTINGQKRVDGRAYK